MSARTDLQAKITEADQVIERLSGRVEAEKAETNEVVEDLRSHLRHNLVLTAAIRATAGLPMMFIKHDQGD